MNEFPRNPKPNRGDIIEITECLSSRPSKYLYVGAKIKVYRCCQRCDVPIYKFSQKVDKYIKMIQFTYKSPKNGGLLYVTERNYSWKIVERSTYTEAESLPKFTDLSKLKVPKEEFDNLLGLMSKKREESLMIDAVKKMNKVLSNYPYPEKDKSHENME